MKKPPESPQEWHAIWRSGLLSGLDFHQGLIYAARFHEPEEVVSVLDQKELAGFKEFLYLFTRDVTPTSPNDTNDEYEVFIVNSPLRWRNSDVFKLRSYLEERDHEKAEQWWQNK